MFKKYDIKNYNFKLIILCLVVSFIGVLLVGSAAEGFQTKQLLGLISGLFLMVIVSLIDYSFVLNFWPFIYGIMVVLLLAVKFFGTNINGATRWINIGFQFQPSEVSKLFVILVFAQLFQLYQDKISNWKTLLFMFGLAIVPLYLIKSEPDLSTTIVIFLIFCAMLFCAGLSYKIIGWVLGIGIPLGGIALAVIIKKGSAFLDSYQLGRIMAWINPLEYADEAYQQQNSIMAIASGQLTGKGLNNTVVSSLKNGNFISEPQTDFIFAIAGEELGFLGCVLIIGLILAIILCCLLVAKKAKDLSGKLICVGMATYIGFQSFVNICVATGFMPNTGLPLPFVSYGLTSIWTLFVGIGFVLNVGLQPRRY